jgi:hypothetical protein
MLENAAKFAWSDCRRRFPLHDFAGTGPAGMTVMLGDYPLPSARLRSTSLAFSTVGPSAVSCARSRARIRVESADCSPPFDPELLGRLPSDAVCKIPRLLAERLQQKTLLNVMATLASVLHGAANRTTRTGFLRNGRGAPDVVRA